MGDTERKRDFNHTETQKGEIGISLMSMVLKPYDNTRQHGQASLRAVDFLMGWLLDPLVYGDYNFSMNEEKLLVTNVVMMKLYDRLNATLVWFMAGAAIIVSL
ncbi:hypothetical protein LguiA_014701 [Lonicera macranthoides]